MERARLTHGDIEPVLEAGLSRNVVLVSILSLTVHALASRLVGPEDERKTAAERGWMIALSAFSALVAIYGIQLHVSRYARLANGPPPLDWLAFAYGLMFALVVLMGVIYPVLYVNA